jgi:hypothetical protein
METWSLERVANDPIEFLRLVVPIAVVLPEVDEGDSIFVFEALNRRRSPRLKARFTPRKIEVITLMLNSAGYEKVVSTSKTRLLFEAMEKHLSSTDMLMRDCPLHERVRALKRAICEDPGFRFDRLIRVAEHLTHAHQAQPALNRARPTLETS